MAICENCRRKVKNVYTWNGKEYGKECWKEIALPEITKMNEEEKKQRLERWNLEARVLIEILRNKDYSRIRSDYKLKVIPDLVKQFDEKQFMTKAQFDMVKTWLTSKETVKWFEMQFELGLCEEIDYYYVLKTFGNKKQIEEGRNWLREHNPEINW